MPELLEKRLNLGAGPLGKNDWINLDYGILPFLGKYKKWIPSPIRKIIPQGYQDIINQWPQNIQLHNCKNRLPFQGNEISHSFTSHFLEHIKKYEAAFVVGEVYRVLKPGGYFRIIVPDLEMIIKKYLEKDDEFFAKIDPELKKYGASTTDMFLTLFYPPFHLIKNQSPINRFINRFARWHMWMYDFDSIKEMLAKAGFIGINKMSHGETNYPGFKELDDCQEISVFAEAKKPFQDIQ